MTSIADIYAPALAAAMGKPVGEWPQCCGAAMQIRITATPEWELALAMCTACGNAFMISRENQKQTVH